MKTMQHAPLNAQGGMTMLGWLIVIAFLLFQGLIAMKIIPVYIDDASVSSIFRNLSNASDLHNASPDDIRDTIEKRLKMNNIYDIKRNQIGITRGNGGYDVTLDYESRGNLVGNLDYVASFNHEATISSSYAQ